MPRIEARKQAHSTYRLRVLTVIESYDGWLTGQQIAQATGLTYKQTVDALNALNNLEKVARTGRKFTALWGKIDTTSERAASESFALLTDCFRSFFK